MPLCGSTVPPAVTPVQVEPCKDVSGVELGIKMGGFVGWRQVETLLYKISSVLYGTYSFTVKMSGFGFPTVMSGVLKNLM